MRELDYDIDIHTVKAWRKAMKSSYYDSYLMAVNELLDADSLFTDTQFLEKLLNKSLDDDD